MALTRHFLGWDEPVVHKVVSFLLPVDGQGPVDLSGDMVVVPTRRAARRLRRALAVACEARGRALWSPQVVTHNALVGGERQDPSVASPSLVRAVWTALLMELQPHDHPGLFPGSVAVQDFAWAERTAVLLEGLRRTLADAGRRLGDVPAAFEDHGPELQRWRDLVELERRYLLRLDAHGLVDPLLHQISAAQSPRPPEQTRRVVVAAVPDPTPLVVEVWQRLSQRLAVVVLVHADPQLADAFDPWGRPCGSVWSSGPIDVPDPSNNILLAQSPSGQARSVVGVLAQESERFGPADVAVGVPDASVVSPLIETLERHGLSAVDPAGQRVDSHPLYRLLEGCRDLVVDRSFDAVRRLLRHPDLLEHWSIQHRVETGPLLTQADRFQNRHLPRSLDDVSMHLKRAEREAYPDLRAVLSWCLRQIECFTTAAPHVAVRRLLKEVYAHQPLGEAGVAGEAMTAVAQVVSEALEQIGDPRFDSIGTPKQQRLNLLLGQLSDQSYYTEHAPAAVDLEGWLELPWSEAPLLVVTGMNDGAVPAGRVSDLFLPDSMCRRLGLRSDTDRLTRDAYLIRSLMACRHRQGRVCFIVGKTGAEGDPLKPSRLLLRCADNDLPTRARQLFAEATDPQKDEPFRVSFRLVPQQPPGARNAARCVDRLSVTAFRRYLACPFRFYLSDVLKMEPLDDTRRLLDAREFGSLIHESLQALGEPDTGGGEMDETALGAMLCDRAQQWVSRRFGPSPPALVAIQLDAARQRLRAAARVHAGELRTGWEVIETELPIRGVVGGVTVVGRVDRVERHRRTGAVRLLDYKTADTAVSPLRAHLAAVRSGTSQDVLVQVGRRRMAWCDLQLPLYRLLVEQQGHTAVSGKEVSVAYFNLPQAVGQTAIEPWDGLDDLLASASACAQWVVQQIQNRRFWPPSDAGRYDDFEPLFCGQPDDCFDAAGFEQAMGGGA